jgi:hypothetical protein
MVLLLVILIVVAENAALNFKLVRYLKWRLSLTIILVLSHFTNFQLDQHLLSIKKLIEPTTEQSLSLWHPTHRLLLQTKRQCY